MAVFSKAFMHIQFCTCMGVNAVITLQLKIFVLGYGVPMSESHKQGDVCVMVWLVHGKNQPSAWSLLSFAACVSVAIMLDLR
jgi:hypothetical protein